MAVDLTCERRRARLCTSRRGPCGGDTTGVAYVGKTGVGEDVVRLGVWELITASDREEFQVNLKLNDNVRDINRVTVETRILTHPPTTHHTRTHRLVHWTGVLALRSVLRPGWQRRQRPATSAARRAHDRPGGCDGSEVLGEALWSAGRGLPRPQWSSPTLASAHRWQQSRFRWDGTDVALQGL